MCLCFVMLCQTAAQEPVASPVIMQEEPIAPEPQLPPMEDPAILQLIAAITQDPPPIYHEYSPYEDEPVPIQPMVRLYRSSCTVLCA